MDNAGDSTLATEAMSQKDRNWLFRILTTRFNLEEIRTLGFELSVDYGDLQGEGKDSKARELITYLELRARIQELVAVVKQKRPDVIWPAPDESHDPTRLSPEHQPEWSTPLYDVFLSYNIEDRDVAKQIAEELVKTRLRVSWELCPGRTWEEGLIEGISVSSTTALLIGPSGVGNWANERVRLALQRYVTKGHTVIPVILPGVGRLPDLFFLGQWALVDCRVGQISHQSLDELIWGITRKRPSRLISQIGDEFFLELRGSNRRVRTINVYTLPNPNKASLLYLTWETFGRGIERLRDQILNWGRQLEVGAYFGINEAGLVMATFLNSAVRAPVKVGYIRCISATGGRKITEDSFFPELSESPTIMLADFEVKSGSALETVVERIRREYSAPKVYLAVFGAITREADLRIQSFEQLGAAEKISELGIEDCFIACTMHPPGIEPPLGVR